MQNVEFKRYSSAFIAVAIAFIIAMSAMVLPVSAAEIDYELYPFDSLPTTDVDNCLIYYNSKASQYYLVYCSDGFKDESIPLTYDESVGYTFSYLPSNKYSVFVSGKDGVWSVISSNQFTSNPVSVTISEINDIVQYPGVFTLDGEIVWPSPWFNTFIKLVGKVNNTVLNSAADLISFISNHTLILINIGLTIVGWILIKVYGSVRGI